MKVKFVPVSSNKLSFKISHHQQDYEINYDELIYFPEIYLNLKSNPTIYVISPDINQYVIKNIIDILKSNEITDGHEKLLDSIVFSYKFCSYSITEQLKQAFINTGYDIHQVLDFYLEKEEEITNSEFFEGLFSKNFEELTNNSNFYKLSNNFLTKIFFKQPQSSFSSILPFFETLFKDPKRFDFALYLLNYLNYDHIKADLEVYLLTKFKEISNDTVLIEYLDKSKNHHEQDQQMAMLNNDIHKFELENEKLRIQINYNLGEFHKNQSLIKEIDDKNEENIILIQIDKATKEFSKTQPKNFESNVFDTVKNNDINSLIYHLHQKIDINQKDEKQNTLLFYATQLSYYRLVKLLVGFGAKVNIKNQEGTTALLEASSNGNFKIVKFLIENGAVIDAQNIFNDTPLGKACRYGHYNIAQLLIEKNAKIEFKNKNDETPLLLAVFHNNLEIVELLIKHRANVDVKDKNNITPIMKAAAYGNRKLLILIFNNSKLKNINDLDNDNYNALHYAVEKGELTTIKYLLKKNINAHQKDKHGNEPLQIAKYLNKLDVIQLLSENGIE